MNEAIRLVGGVDNFSRMLDIKKAHVVAYSAGIVNIPEGLFLRIVDVISAHKKPGA